MSQRPGPGALPSVISGRSLSSAGCATIRTSRRGGTLRSIERQIGVKLRWLNWGVVSSPLPKAGRDGTSRRMVGRYARNLICEQSVELHDPATAQALLAKVQPS